MKPDRLPLSLIRVLPNKYVLFRLLTVKADISDLPMMEVERHADFAIMEFTEDAKNWIMDLATVSAEQYNKTHADKVTATEVFEEMFDLWRREVNIKRKEQALPI